MVMENMHEVPDLPLHGQNPAAVKMYIFHTIHTWLCFSLIASPSSLFPPPPCSPNHRSKVLRESNCLLSSATSS